MQPQAPFLVYSSSPPNAIFSLPLSYVFYDRMYHSRKVKSTPPVETSSLPVMAAPYIWCGRTHLLFSSLFCLHLTGQTVKFELSHVRYGIRAGQYAYHTSRHRQSRQFNLHSPLAKGLIKVMCYSETGIYVLLKQIIKFIAVKYFPPATKRRKQTGTKRPMDTPDSSGQTASHATSHTAHRHHLLHALQQGHINAVGGAL